MSLLPVATGWVGKFLNSAQPEYLYLIVFTFWSITYLWLFWPIKNTAEHQKNQVSRKIDAMPPYKFLSSFFFPISVIIIAG